MPQLAIRTRSGRVESIHSGIICVTDSLNHILHSIGNTRAGLFLRSSGKPFLAVAFVHSGAMQKFNITQKELAVICSSHSGQAFHRRTVLSILNKIGLKESDLDCGHANPEDKRVENALIKLGKRPTCIFSNCSGKHAGLLALCKFYDYPIEGYTSPDHPVQQLIRKTMAELLECDERELVIGKDGCTNPTYFVTLQQAAWLYARLAHGYGAGGPYDGCLDIIKKAMIAHPRMISGDGTFATDLVRMTKGRVIGKIGAEGILCLAIPEKKLGVCINVRDGHPWSTYPIAIRVLEELEVLDATTVEKLSKWTLPPLKDDKGGTVGYLHPTFSLIQKRVSHYEMGDVFPAGGR
jgi:L-asparaginase II